MTNYHNACQAVIRLRPKPGTDAKEFTRHLCRVWSVPTEYVTAVYMKVLQVQTKQLADQMINHKIQQP